MRKFEADFYFKFLKLEEVSLSDIPKSILNSQKFNQLKGANIIVDEKIGRGRKFYIKNKTSFEKWLSNHANFDEKEVENKSDSVSKYRDSKIGKTIQKPFYFLRGSNKIKIVNQEIDLKYFTSNFGGFVTNSLNLSSKIVCIIENKESFLRAEEIFGEDMLFIHKYGRWGRQDLVNLSAQEIIVFSDYDLVGINEFLEISEGSQNAKFFVPENFSDLFSRYSRECANGIQQKMSEKVKNSKNEMVNEIRDLVLQTNRFLEQESLFIKKYEQSRT